MNAESLLDQLDDDQRLAVTCAPTATVVHAGAGSGKTRVLTHRIAWRIAQGDIDPARVLAITFTREAASEMRRRLRALGIARHDRAGDSDQPTIGTFHSVALALLRRRASDTSAAMPNVVGNRQALLNRVLGENSLGRRAGTVLAEIDWAKARVIAPEHYAREAQRANRAVPIDLSQVADAYARYETERRRRGLVDLDDLILLATQSIRQRADFAAATRFRFRHLFVDEAQDMNPLQFAFFEALRGDNKDVFVVGDPLQAIYGWNGADPELFLRLPDVLPQATLLALPNNYRCTPQVLAVAARVAAHDGAEPDVRSRRSNGLPVQYIEVDDEVDELLLVVNAAQRHMQTGVEPSFAVLARTNAVLEHIAESLRANGVPVASRRASAMRNNAIDEVAECRNRHDLGVWAADVIVESSDPDERIVAEQVHAYLRSSTHGQVDGRSAAAFLRASHTAPDRFGVELLTFHSAKGREFQTVFIVGAEKGLLPHSGAKSQAQLREEARLAYVACTRAADRLVIVRARKRNMRNTSPSEFFSTLPQEVERRSQSELEQPRAALPKLSVPIDPHVAADRELKRRLCVMRDVIARTNYTMPEAVLSDSLVARIVREKPRDMEHLSRILGPLTATRLGAAILREIGPVE